MPFVAQLDLDGETNALLDAIAGRLEGIPGLETVRRIGDVHHVSLGIYDGVPAERLREEVARFAETVEPIAIRLANVGVFPGPPYVLYLGPVVTEDLIALHGRFHASLSGFAESCWVHYRPRAWVPHVTLAMDVEPDALAKAFAVLRVHWEPQDARLDAVRLIRVRPVKTLYFRSLLNDEGSA